MATLPIVQSKKEQDPMLDAPERMTDKPSILLVEDDEDDYILTEALLVGIFGSDFKFDWVKDWSAALEAIEQEEHDVYLIDHRLGERTGLDLVAEANLRGHKAPMILLTG